MNLVNRLIDSYIENGLTEEEAMRKVAKQLDEGRGISCGDCPIETCEGTVLKNPCGKPRYRCDTCNWSTEQGGEDAESVVSAKGFDYFHHNANLRPETDTPEKPSPDAWENLTYETEDGVTRGGGVVKRKDAVDWPDEYQRPLFAAATIQDTLVGLFEREMEDVSLEFRMGYESALTRVATRLGLVENHEEIEELFPER